MGLGWEAVWLPWGSNQKNMDLTGQSKPSKQGLAQRPVATFLFSLFIRTQSTPDPWSPGLQLLPELRLRSWCGLILLASLSHSLHVPLPISFIPVLLLTWIPGPASRSVQFLAEPQACWQPCSSTQNTVRWVSVAQYGWPPLWNKIQWPVLSPLSPHPWQHPSSLTHPHKGKGQLGAIKSDHYAHRLQPPVPPSKMQTISAQPQNITVTTRK